MALPLLKHSTSRTHEQESDAALFRAALRDLKSYVRRFQDVAERAQNPICQMTFHVVTLFCEGAAGALQAYLDQCGDRPEFRETDASKKLQALASQSEHTEWRPSAEPQIPLP